VPVAGVVGHWQACLPGMVLPVGHTCHFGFPHIHACLTEYCSSTRRITTVGNDKNGNVPTGRRLLASLPFTVGVGIGEGYKVHFGNTAVLVLYFEYP
jgi:hypothetical protein